MFILAVNCGSSSIKGKLFEVPKSKTQPLSSVASLSVTNISSKGEKVKIKVSWEDRKGKNVDTEGEDGDSVECECWPGSQFRTLNQVDESLMPQLLSHLTASSSLDDGDIEYVTHRV
jgi:acetate kinase